MPRIDVWFLFLAALCLVVGVGLGIYMGVAQDFQLAPVHGHLNLVGWASLALFAALYRAFPELARSPLASVHFWLAVVSGPAFPVGIYLAAIHHMKLLAIVASLVWMAGALVFLANVARMIFASSPAPVRADMVAHSTA
jgi:hypothetical protein